MSELGHECSTCGLEWVHEGCYRRLEEGLKINCPRCSGRILEYEKGWHYLDDDFTRWVMEVRKKYTKRAKS